MRNSYHVILVLSFVCFVSALHAQQNTWIRIDKAKIGFSTLQRKTLPKNYKTFKLDVEQLKNDLSHAHSSNRSGKTSVLISLPDAQGGLSQYEVKEASVMAPGLAEKYPNNRSYTGESIQNPLKKVRFSMNEAGLSAIIMDVQEGSVLIEPIGNVAKDYMVYTQSSRDVIKDFQCLTAYEPLFQHGAKNKVQAAKDGFLSTYRLALSANGEYTQFHLREQNAVNANERVKKEVVMAALTTAVTRVNALLERDLSVSLQLVDKNDELIFIDPNDDPFNNRSPEQMLVQNQSLLDKVIRPENYDLGQVFSMSPSVAVIRSTCIEGLKAQGVSGAGEPIGDTFYYDVFAHEIGHQLGANHTFNGSKGACGQEGQRVLETAVEPGSGSSIMSYAGLCGIQDVQDHSDVYFHALSLQEINTFIGEGGVSNCGILTALDKNKNRPTAYAGEDLLIPKGTAFALTAEGADADGDQVSFCWEQMDNGVTAVPPSENATGGALYRSKEPTPDPVRFFPDLKWLRAGALSSKWEVTPAVARNINFRLTVRDHHEEGGRLNSDDLKITVSDIAGPFAVTSQNGEGISWQPGSKETVVWDVSGTDANGIDVSHVNILLSTDGGFSYPVVLAAGVENNGQHEVTVPDVQAPHCFVMVQAVDHVFFAVNSVYFSIGDYEKTCITYYSDDIPKKIAYGVSNNVVSFNEVEDDYSIIDVTVGVRIKHTFIQDLALSLESPKGTVIDLLNRPCSQNDEDIDVVFNDKGEVLYCASAAPAISGNVKSISTLSDLNNEGSKGKWQLKVADEFEGDDGFLELWSVTLCTLQATLGIEDEELEEFAVFPNPSKGAFTVQFNGEETGDVVLKIHDLLGRSILQTSYSNESLQFEALVHAEHLKSGIYFLEVSRGSKISHRKLQINR